MRCFRLLSGLWLSLHGATLLQCDAFACFFLRLCGSAHVEVHEQPTAHGLQLSSAQVFVGMNLLFITSHYSGNVWFCAAVWPRLVESAAFTYLFRINY